MSGKYSIRFKDWPQLAQNGI